MEHRTSARLALERRGSPCSCSLQGLRSDTPICPFTKECPFLCCHGCRVPIVAALDALNFNAPWQSAARKATAGTKIDVFYGKKNRPTTRTRKKNYTARPSTSVLLLSVFFPLCKHGCIPPPGTPINGMRTASRGACLPAPCSPFPGRWSAPDCLAAFPRVLGF
jgi:hypothetical protein